MAGQLWTTNSLGGFFYSQQLSDELRMDLLPMEQFRQFADARDASAQGKGHGQIFTWDMVGTLSRANRSLTETNTMPESNFIVKQGTGTVVERGVAVPYTGMLEALSKFSVRSPIMKALKADANRDLDALAYNQFNNTPLRYASSTATNDAATAFTTNGTATLTNSQAMGTYHVKQIIDKMRERNIPFYTDNNYVAVGWPTTFRAVKNTLETLHQYTETGLSLIFNGEIGRYEQTRFVEQTNVPKGGAADSTTFDPLNNVADGWNGAFSDWVFFIGEEPVIEGVAVPMEIRAKIPSDYGRSKGVAWYWLGGYAAVRPSGTTDPDNWNVIKWDSAV